MSACAQEVCAKPLITQEGLAWSPSPAPLLVEAITLCVASLTDDGTRRAQDAILTQVMTCYRSGEGGGGAGHSPAPAGSHTHTSRR